VLQIVREEEVEFKKETWSNASSTLHHRDRDKYVSRENILADRYGTILT